MRKNRVLPLAAASLLLLGLTSTSAFASLDNGNTAYDSFSRSVSSGLGASQTGGIWNTSSPASFSVNNDLRVDLQPGTSATAILPEGASAETEARIVTSLSVAPSGGGTYASLVTRSVDASNDYRARLRFLSDNTLQVQLTRRLNGSEVILNRYTVPGISYAPNQKIVLKGLASNSSPTHLAVKAWRAGTTEPGWQLEMDDASPSLQSSGTVGLSAYLSGATSGSQRVSFDDLKATTSYAEIVSGPSGSVASKIAFFGFEATRSTLCQLDAAALTPCTDSVSFSGLSEGSHTFTVQAGLVSTSRTWTVDTVAPTVSLAGVPLDSTSTSASLSFSVNEDATTSCKLDSGSWTSCTSSVSYGSLGAGSHSISVKAQDLAGNSSTVSTSWQVQPGRPSSNNTGVPLGTQLTPYYGNLTITTPNAVYDSLDIHGFVNVKAPGVKITRSVVRGGSSAGGNIGLITNTTANASVTVEDSEVVPEFPSVLLDGIKGNNFTVRRTNIHGTVDGVKVHGNNVTVEDSFIHDLVLYANDPYQNNGPSHNDGVQVLGGQNISILRNTIKDGNNAALMVTQDYSATSNLNFSYNWADNGGCTVNLNHKKLSSMSGVTVSNNRFGRNTRNSDCAIISTAATSLTASNNVWDDNSLPVRIRNGG